MYDLFANPHHVSLIPYIGRALDEVKDEALAELSHTSSLSVLACVEAAVRMDYGQRVSGKAKSPLSRSLRDIYKKKGDRARLDEDLLAAWKEHSELNPALFSALIGAFKYRHWLAHGRYWVPKFGRPFDYQTVYDIADAFLVALDQCP